MNKKIIYILIGWFLLPISVWAQTQTEELFSLSDFTRAQANHYYKRHNFTDPGNSSGWYRVDNFLNWVDQHENILIKIFQQNYVDEYTAFPPKNQDDVTILAAFLGLYYTASRCQTDLAQVKHVDLRPAFNSAAGTKSIDIAINNSFIQTVNSGLHEGAHILPYLCYGIPAQSPNDNLSELIPLSAQQLYGLPTHPDDTMPSGTRNIMLDLRSNQQEVLSLYTQELLAFLQQNILFRQFNSGNLRPFTKAKLERPSFSLDQFITDLIDLDQGKLYQDGIALSLSEYLQLIHVQSRELNQVSSFVGDFLAQLKKQAPFPKRLKAREWTSYSDKYDSYLEKNQNTIKSILLRLTQSYSAPPTPSGFL